MAQTESKISLATQKEESIMELEVGGKILTTTATGFLENLDEWSKEVATAMASQENLELIQEHWDIIEFLRDEYFGNNGNQPNNRVLIKEMTAKWIRKVTNK